MGSAAGALGSLRQWEGFSLPVAPGVPLSPLPRGSPIRAQNPPGVWGALGGC